jgi:hypothetical protein
VPVFGLGTALPDAGVGRSLAFFAVAVSGNDILVAGGTDYPSSGGSGFSSRFGFWARMHSDGSVIQPDFRPYGVAPDPNFGFRVDTDVDGYYGIAPRDGHILLTGSQGTHSFVRAFQNGGVLDPAFATAGQLSFPTESAATAGGASFLAQGANTLVYAGGARVLGGHEMELARMTPGGALDTTFGSQGLKSSGFFTSQLPSTTFSLGCDGRIIAYGNKGDQPALLAYGPNGAPDPSLDAGALPDPNFPGSGYAGAGVASLVDPRNGKLVLVYHTDEPAVRVVRFFP